MRKVVVVGLAKSGIEAARLLASRKDTVFITELKNDESARKTIDMLVKEGAVRPENIEPCCKKLVIRVLEEQANGSVDLVFVEVRLFSLAFSVALAIQIIAFAVIRR